VIFYRLIFDKSSFNIVLHLQTRPFNGVVVSISIFVNGGNFIVSRSREVLFIFVHLWHSWHTFIKREILCFPDEGSILYDKVVLVFGRFILRSGCSRVLWTYVLFVEGTGSFVVVIESWSWSKLSDVV
jgi:hypothetical protein